MRLKNEFGKPDIFYENWDKIIDKTVYNQNGLRLLWSDKCKRSDNECEYENRIYVIYKIYEDYEENKDLTNKFLEDRLLALKSTSIRTDKQSITEYFNLVKYEEIVENEQNTIGSYIKIKEDSHTYEAIKKFL